MTNIDPVVTGRIVQGDPWVGSTQGYQGKVREKPQWFMGLAVPKMMADGVTPNPEMATLYGVMLSTAQQAFANTRDYERSAFGAPNTGFGWKVEDGDLTPSKEGFAGCWVLKLNTQIAPQFYNENNQQLTDQSQLKRGDYVQVRVGVAANKHGGTPQAALYLNHNMVKRVGFGDPIVSGPSADDVFGSAPVTLPPGASATPVGAPVGMPAPVAAAPAPVAPVAAAPAPVAPVAAAPAPVAPNPAILQPPVAPTVPGQ